MKQAAPSRHFRRGPESEAERCRPPQRHPRRPGERPLYPFATRTPVLLVPGSSDGSPAHWQTLWQQEHPTFRRVACEGLSAPDQWVDAVAEAIDALRTPPIIVAHRLGCLATVAAATARRKRVAGALLVAPSDADAGDGIAAALATRSLPFPSTVVASTDDPRLKFVRAGALASRWGSRLVALSGTGRRGSDSGLGSWPWGLALLRDLAERAAAAGTLAPRRGGMTEARAEL